MAITAAAVVGALLVAGAFVVVVVLSYYLSVRARTWHMIRSSWISRPPYRSSAFSLQFIQTPSTLAPRPYTFNTMN